jgi:hypothetical protein
MRDIERENQVSWRLHRSDRDLQKRWYIHAQDYTAQQPIRRQSEPTLPQEYKIVRFCCYYHHHRRNRHDDDYHHQCTRTCD